MYFILYFKLKYSEFLKFNIFTVLINIFEKQEQKKSIYSLQKGKFSK